MEKGLYKYDGELMFAELMVSYPNGTTLTVVDYEGTDGEVYDGWHWFDTRQAACDYFGVENFTLNQSK
jgi:hypothetical protein